MNPNYPSPEKNEDNFITQIPESETGGLLILTNTEPDENNQKRQLVGKLMNPPIEVGQPIKLSTGRSAIVEKIKKNSDNYKIYTKDSAYIFNPKKSLPE